MLFSNEHFALTFRVRGEDQSQEEAANQCTVTWNGCAAVRLFDCIAAVSQICTVLHFWFILSFWFFLLRRSLSIDYGHLLPLLCGISIIFEFVVTLHIRMCFPLELYSKKILAALEWYVEHLRPLNKQVILLAETTSLLKAASARNSVGYAVMSLSQYLSTHHSANTELLELYLSFTGLCIMCDERVKAFFFVFHALVDYSPIRVSASTAVSRGSQAGERKGPLGHPTTEREKHIRRRITSFAYFVSLYRYSAGIGTNQPVVRKCSKSSL